MKKIIHLTDTHIGYQDLSTKMGDIVTRIIYTKEDASNYIIVHTGDVVEDATRAGSYEEAWSHFKRLKDAGFVVLFVPGNHDYGTGSYGSKEYVDRFKKCFFAGKTNITYPIKTVIDEIAFIGLDSMAEELNFYDRFFAEGELGEEQLERLSDMLNTAVVKHCQFKVVYLHHHPFHPKPFHQLKDSEALGAILKKHTISALLLVTTMMVESGMDAGVFLGFMMVEHRPLKRENQILTVSLIYRKTLLLITMQNSKM